MEGTRLDKVVFQNPSVWLMTVSKNWQTNHTSISWGENLTLSVVPPHLRFLFFSSLRCQILKDLVEWRALSFMWKHHTLHRLISLYGSDAEYWRRSCRHPVVEAHTVRDHRLHLLCFPGWFTLLSSFWFMCSACKPNRGIYLINYLSAFAVRGISQIC